MKRLAYGFVLVGLMATGAEARVWSDATGGQKIEGEYVALKDGKVMIRLPSGKIGSIQLEKLSPADQEFAKSQPAFAASQPKPAAPAVDVDAAAAADAKDRFSIAIQNNPTDPSAYYNRGLARLNQGKTGEAMADFDKAIELKPNFAAAYDGRGMALSKSGKPFEAHSNFDKAIQLDPELASAYRNRGDNVKELWNTPQGQELLKERSEEYRKRYEKARESNLSKTPWQPLNTTSGNTTVPALNMMRDVDYQRAREIEGQYGGGGYGISVGGVGIGGTAVKITGPGITAPATGTIVGNPPLAVYPEEVTQGQTITLVANPAELAKNMPVQLGPTGKPLRAGRNGAPKEPIYSVDFYRDVDGDGLMNPDADEYLATDKDGKDGFSAEVSTAGFPPGNQAYFAVGRGQQPAGVPETYEQAAEAMKKAAATQREIAESAAKAAAEGASTETAQNMRKDQQSINEKAQAMATGYRSSSPELANILSQATKPMTAVDNRLAAAEKKPGEDSKPIMESGAEKAKEAADLLDQAYAKLAEKAAQSGEGGPSPAAPASAAAAASGKIKPGTPGPAQTAAAPKPGKPAYSGDKDGYDKDDGVDIHVHEDNDDDVVVRDTIDRALGYIDDGDYDRAVVEYDRYLHDTPDDRVVLEHRADAYVNRGSYDYAVRDYDRLVGMGVMTAELYYNRGCAHLAAGDVEAAIKDFDASIALDETRNLAYTNRGSAYARRGEFKRAIEDFDAAIKINSTDQLAYRNRALAFKKLGELDKAEADLARVQALVGAVGGE